MERYPHDIVEHNLPFVLLLGLESGSKNETPAQSPPPITPFGDGGFRIRARLPSVTGRLADDLRTTLLSYDASDQPWRSLAIEKGRSGISCRVESVGREYLLPPRKAPPQPRAPRFGPTDNGGLSPPPLTLHSTLSPLSPSSSLYPDGIIDSAWISKHQHRLPSVLVAFYTLAPESPDSAIQDENIRQEVLNIKNVINASHYRSKLVVVLLGAGSVGHADLEDRLIKIRKGANIESRSLYYLPASASHVEVAEFAGSLMSTIYPSAIEYYRDLSKQVRRKRNRNGNSQTGIHQTDDEINLSPQGWTTRYEFKLAVLAEFRQEMNAASRNYETAYEALLAPRNLASLRVSRRARENQTLLDIIAIRIIRCLCWNSQTSQAVRWWRKHRDKMKEILSIEDASEELSKWTSWQSGWAMTMADVVSRARLFDGQERLGVYLSTPNAGLVLERQNPWDNLHHEGYWLRQALDGMTWNEIQDVQKVSMIASKMKEMFHDHKQARFTQWLVLQEIRKTFDNGNNRTQDTALSWPLRLNTWPMTGWWRLHQQVLLVMMNFGTAPLASLTDNGNYSDLMMSPRLQKCYASTPDNDGGPPLAGIVLSFAFAAMQGHINEPLGAQFGMHFQTPCRSKQHLVTEVCIEFDDSMPPLRLVHSADSGVRTGEHIFGRVDIHEIQSTQNVNSETDYISTVDLTPRAHSIFDIDMVAQREGTTQLKQIVLTMREGDNDATRLVFEHDLIVTQQWWEAKHNACRPRHFGRHREGSSVDILPRLPRLIIRMPESKIELYLNEVATLTLEIENGEEEEIMAEVGVSLSSTPESRGRIRIEGMPATVPLSDGTNTLQLRLESVKSRAIVSRALVLEGLYEPGRHDIEANIHYQLGTDSSRQLKAQARFGVSVVRPLQASGTFAARVDGGRWPGLFTVPDSSLKADEKAVGLTQRYTARVSLASLAAVDLEIHSLKLTAQEATGGVMMLASFAKLTSEHREGPAHTPHILHSGEVGHYDFDLTVQKLALGDRTPVAIVVMLDLKWSRRSSESRCLERLPISRLVPNMSEPRVLVEVKHVPQEPQLILLTYTIENPSMHFLTFRLTMERGAHFAFSGPKSRTVSLTPLSRIAVSYRLYIQKNREWLSVNLEVFDTFFGQILGVQPASDGIRLDKEGGVQVWSGDG